jgi:5'-3' exonuclease
MQSGYESDDLIAWIVCQVPDEYVIVTGDDDLLQLLHSETNCPVCIYNLSKKKVVTEADFVAKYNIQPRSWPMVKAMGGCTTDNVRGIPGVGTESAIKYINSVLKDGAIKNKIESSLGKELTKDCMKLVLLPFNGDRPIDIISDHDTFRQREKFYSLNFMDVFKRYGFNSFLSEQSFSRWRKAFQLIPGRAQ